MQYPSGMSFFRPDLNFDGASEREIEVSELLNIVENDRLQSKAAWTHQVKKTSFSLPMCMYVCFFVYTAVHADKKLLG